MKLIFLMKNKIIILIFFAFMLTPSAVFAQKDSVNIALDLIYNENFNQAIELYKKVIKYDKKNPVHHFNLGFCYLHTREKRDSAIESFQNSIKYYKKKKHKRDLNINKVKFYLARAYRVNYMFDSSVVILKELKQEVKNRRFLKVIDSELELAEDGAKLLNNPADIVIIQNLGNQINTEYSEHTPVFSADESMLIFTSRRKLNEQRKLLWDNEYDENIYVAYKQGESWTEPVSISDNINTTEHEATIGLSYDGTMLLIYKEENEGDIYYSKYINGEWSVPQAFGAGINTKYRETHASISIDGEKLFFTSDRPNGFGGLDIYVCTRKKDGNWSSPVNMGGAINSERDEEGPYIHHDNKTLYFSSKGFGGFGGYDIFTSTIDQDGIWSNAVNIGFPINSVDDDIFYFPTADGNRAYFSSLKGSGYGKSDIYMMSIPQAEKSNLCIMTALLSVCEDDLPMPYIIIKNNQTKKYYSATAKDGKFIFVTEKGKSYTVSVEVENNEVFSESFTVSEDAPNYMLYKNIRLDPDVPCGKAIQTTTEIDSLITPDSTEMKYVEIENILFPYARAEKIQTNPVLDTLALYLKNNKEAIIELGGYCDSRGRASYNFLLGYKRATVVKDYLIEKGVSEEQLIVKSYGEENPITRNKDKNGNWLIESQKYNRRVEFRIIRQGETSLLIWGAEVPQEYKSEKYIINYKKNEKNNKETTW